MPTPPTWNTASPPVEDARREDVPELVPEAGRVESTVSDAVGPPVRLVEELGLPPASGAPRTRPAIESAPTVITAARGPDRASVDRETGASAGTSRGADGPGAGGGGGAPI